MRESLKEKWQRSGLESGDLVLVHSNIQRTIIESRRMGLNIGPDEILESFLDAIGPRGTILLPLFNFDFTKGVCFDIRNTPSQMGALTEAGRKYSGAVRTGHPVYSFCVIGYRSGIFELVDNRSAYGENSPFGILKNLEGKIASLDLEDQNSMTFYHHVEEVIGVDYRYHKPFTADYVGWDGVLKTKTYEIFVRDTEHGVKTNVNPTGELLWKAGIYKGFRPKTDTGLRVLRASEMFTYVEGIIRDGRALGNLFTLGE